MITVIILLLVIFSINGDQGKTISIWINETSLKMYPSLWVYVPLLEMFLLIGIILSFLVFYHLYHTNFEKHKLTLAQISLILGAFLVLWQREAEVIRNMNGFDLAHLFLSTGGLMLVGGLLSSRQENGRDGGCLDNIGNIIYGIGFSIFLGCLLWIALGASSRDAYCQFFNITANEPQNATPNQIIINPIIINATIINSTIINPVIVDERESVT